MTTRLFLENGLNRRDTEIVRLFYRYGVLNADQTTFSLGVEGIMLSSRTVRNALYDLEKRGFLVSHTFRFQVDGVLTSVKLYALAASSRSVRKCFSDTSPSDWNKQKRCEESVRDPAGRALYGKRYFHEAAIKDFLACFCSQQESRVIDWSYPKIKFKGKVGRKGQPQDQVLMPDVFVDTRWGDEPSCPRHGFYLELDWSKKREEEIRDRFERYLYYAYSRQWKKDFSCFPTLLILLPGKHFYQIGLYQHALGEAIKETKYGEKDWRRVVSIGISEQGRFTVNPGTSPSRPMEEEWINLMDNENFGKRVKLLQLIPEKYLRIMERSISKQCLSSDKPMSPNDT